MENRRQKTEDLVIKAIMIVFIVATVIAVLSI